MPAEPPVADVDLIYGPGAPMAVLTGNLRSVTFKHGLSLNLDARDDELEDSLRFHLSAKAGATIAARLPKSLRMCFPVFSKRHAELTAELDDSRTVSFELAPLASREAYKAVVNAYCDLIAAYFSAEDDAAKEAVLAGARWEQGLARLDVDATGQGLAWRP